MRADGWIRDVLFEHEGHYAARRGVCGMTCDWYFSGGDIRSFANAHHAHVAEEIYKAGLQELEDALSEAAGWKAQAQEANDSTDQALRIAQAEALRDAAVEWNRGPDYKDRRSAVAQWLVQRADKIEGKVSRPWWSTPTLSE